MKCIRNQILSWEPLEIRFVPKKKKKGWEKDVFSWLQGWEEDRLPLAGDLETSQLPLEYYVADVLSDGTVIVHIEWLCEKSLDIIEEYIRKNGTNIKMLIIGEDPNQTVLSEPVGSDITFIEVPRKQIHTENEENVKVHSFEISKYPITVGQFKTFAGETHYKTTNEKKGCYLTYLDNDLLIGMSREERESTPATCLSFHDALEYCKWARVRLPSDHEWLSASVLDWEREYKENDISEELLQEYISKPIALKWISSEWISEYDSKNDRFVVREGPAYLLQKGWKRKRLRVAYPSDYTDLILQFRVCRPT